MKTKRIPGPRPPWLTADGYLDPSRLPLDPYLDQAVSEDEKKSRNGIGILSMMHGHGRREAGIFLVGLLVHAPDDWEKRIRIVEALHEFKTEGCARVLFGELKRVKNSNTTRKYLDAVIKALSWFPPELVRARFEELAEDQSFSYRMREKLRVVLNRIAFHNTMHSQFLERGPDEERP